MKKVKVLAGHTNSSLADIAHALIMGGLYDIHVGLSSLTLDIQEENADALKEEVIKRLENVVYHSISII